MKYYPMDDSILPHIKNHRFSYTVIVNSVMSKGGKEEYINRNIRVNSDIKLDENELVQRAADVAYGLMKTHFKLASSDMVQIVGVTFVSANDREMK